MQYKNFFLASYKRNQQEYLHGALLHPYYVEVDRINMPKNFIQALPEEYNDILNNYRVVLGEYQFKRSMFAKTFLYKEDWDSLYSFAFSREPVDRCVSMFYYLFWRNSGLKNNILHSVKTYINNRKIYFNTSYAFDAFLEYVHEARTSQSIYRPLGNHFTTHTAPMWDDITDFEGNVLLKKVFRLENLVEGINSAFKECGINKEVEGVRKKLNKNLARKNFSPSKTQISKIRELYPNDFGIYENAGFNLTPNIILLILN